MKPSAYNFIWPSDDGDTLLLFNSLSMALREMDTICQELLQTPQFDYTTLTAVQQRYVRQLQPQGFVIPDEVNEEKVLQALYRSSAYDRVNLHLAIAPTLECNFSCTYCYQQPGEMDNGRQGNHVFMPEEVQQKLLAYIDESTETVRNLSLIWYGGEPLLAIDIVCHLSKSIVAITHKKQIGYRAKVITNGYLLTQPGIVQKLIDSHISRIDLTLDGPPEVHNGRRRLKTGHGPTFDHILEGLRQVRAQGLEVQLRINADRSNQESLFGLLDILDQYHLRDIPIVLGRVGAYTSGCKLPETSYLSDEEFSRLAKQFRKPQHPCLAHPCSSNKLNAYVIDPDGDLYKCWIQIGEKQHRIGNITYHHRPGIQERMREIDWLTWEPFDSAHCKPCKLLPICMGGCSYRARFISSSQPPCPEWKYNLKEWVKEQFRKK